MQSMALCENVAWSGICLWSAVLEFNAKISLLSGERA